MGELEDELERQLEEKAKRNELSSNDVKRLLRDVLTQEDVSKYVESTIAKPALHEYQLKITRAKAKELIDRIPKIAPLLCLPTPQKKSGIDVLIREELPEDSSDEEYQPLEETVEDDDDSMLAGGEASIASQACSTPAPLVPTTESDENIGQRTRSKLSLSKTPLETIEQAFIPPDITEDMYDTECDNQDWLNFLKELVQPLDTSAGQEAHDDENDPEYNIQPDELKAPDTEELRVDSAVKISKKEINDLIDELLEYTNMHEDGLPSDEEKANEDLNRLPSEPIYPITEPHNHSAKPSHSTQATSPTAPVTKHAPVPKYAKIPSMFSEEQHQLVRQQLAQHVQLLLQTFLLSCGSPFVSDELRETGKSCLMELKSREDSASVADSAFSIPTLDESLELLTTYEAFVNANLDAMLKWNQEKASHKKYVKTAWAGCAPVHPVLMKVCLRSKAFPYPLLLPRNGFRDTTKARVSHLFSPAQDLLVTLGLHDCTTNLGMKLNDAGLLKCSNLINTALIPDRSPNQILDRIRRKCIRSPENNPIRQFVEWKCTPGVEHFVVAFDRANLQPLYLQDTKLIDVSWHKVLYEERDYHQALLAQKKRKRSQNVSPVKHEVIAKEEITS